MPEPRALCVFLPLQLPGLNAVTRKNRASKYAGAGQKKAIEAEIVAVLRLFKVRPLHERLAYRWRFTWHELHRRRDPDNIASACKFIFDALQAADIIQNDGWHTVAEIVHRFQVSDEGGVLIEAIPLWRDEP